jgi:aminomethyltransferase
MIDKDLTTVKFGQATYAKVAGVECHIARGGYTGEDGFEVGSHVLELQPMTLTNRRSCCPDLDPPRISCRDHLEADQLARGISDRTWCS